MGISIWQILIIVAVVVLLFGAGKIPRLAKDLGAGVNAFKKGLKDSDSARPGSAAAAADDSPRTIEATATTTPVSTSASAHDEVAKG